MLIMIFILQNGLLLPKIAVFDIALLFQFIIVKVSLFEVYITFSRLAYLHYVSF
jgi:hypothetical protein